MIPIRAFIGIEFDSECKRNIYKLQQEFKRLAVRGRWKYSDNFHLTLKFLGDIETRRQSEINDALKAICSGHGPFRLGMSEPGVFQSGIDIRVLWLGLSGDLPQLHSLSSAIDRSLEGFGFKPEKREYHPHVTIGQDIQFAHPFEQVRKEIAFPAFGPVDVKSFALIKSEQIQNKRVYTKVSEYILNPQAT